MKMEALDFFIPDGVCAAEAQARTSHLGIGAHQDDLEFMAFHGISLCYQQEMQWFGGVTCTDGSGSARAGAFADKSDEEMKLIRAQEQRRAASIGEYSFMRQLGHPSSLVKSAEARAPLVDQLEQILLRTQPEIVYTHNPADSHTTHVAVCAAVIEALLRLPPYSRPKKVYGCEVWRGLDWLTPEDKIALDVSGHSELAERLHACFESQIAGGKDYGRAVMGRRRANATFLESHCVDAVDKVWYAIDLTPLIEEKPPTLEEFLKNMLQRFVKAAESTLWTVCPPGDDYR
jgi:LmbE family N-acetylglucosaminyl deacetylase